MITKASVTSSAAKILAQGARSAVIIQNPRTNSAPVYLSNEGTTTGLTGISGASPGLELAPGDSITYRDGNDTRRVLANNAIWAIHETTGSVPLIIHTFDK